MTVRRRPKGRGLRLRPVTPCLFCGRCATRSSRGDWRRESDKSSRRRHRGAPGHRSDGPGVDPPVRAHGNPGGPHVRRQRPDPQEVTGQREVGVCRSVGCWSHGRRRRAPPAAAGTTRAEAGAATACCGGLSGVLSCLRRSCCRQAAAAAARTRIAGNRLAGGGGGGGHASAQKAQQCSKTDRPPVLLLPRHVVRGCC